MPSKSLEALERLCKVKIYQKEASAYDYLGKEIYKEEFNIIKQDLERLEQLEKENQELKQDIVSFEDYSYDLDCEKELLEKENLELKELQELNKQGLWNLKQENLELSQIMQLNNEYIAGVERVKTDLINENKKYKKAIADEIDILLARRFDAYECDDYQTYNLLNTIIEELEEVLE